MGIEPGRCLVVGDSAPGITAAAAAGMTAIGFTGGRHCRPGHNDRLWRAGRSSSHRRYERAPRRAHSAVGEVALNHGAGQTPRTSPIADRIMRLLPVIILVLPLATGCTPYLPEKADFGTSAAVPGTGDIPPEFAQFNAYDPGVNPVLADQICATPHRPIEQDTANASPGKLIQARGVCATHIPIIGSAWSSP
jgi:hypothetical protein